MDAGGNPYGTSLTVDMRGNFDVKVLVAVNHQARRVVTVAETLLRGQEAR